MFTIYRRIYRFSFYWTTCGWSDRVRNARYYRTAAEAKVVRDRMSRDGIETKIAMM